VGYTLEFQNRKGQNELQKQVSEISTKIKKFISTGLLHANTNLNVIKYAIPQSEQSKFYELFLELEKLKDLQVKIILSISLRHYRLIFKWVVLKKLFFN